MQNKAIDIVKYLKEAYKFGWITPKDGNISIKKGKFYYISKSGINKHAMDYSDITSFHDEDIEYPSDASIETEMHHLVHKTMKEEGVVIHVHPPHIIAAMEVLKDGLAKAVYDYPELSRYTRLGPDVQFFGPGSYDLASSTAKAIDAADIVGLRRHGVVSKGKTAEEAFQHIERLEHVCKIILLTRRY